jgi:hypothetical protein
VSDTTRSFLPGGWYAVLSDQVTLLLPASEKQRVAGLWEVVDEGAGFDEVLDRLLSGGLRALPAFVLVGLSGARVQVVVRGDLTATFTAGGEQVVVDGSTATTWAERVLTQVSAMDVVLEETADDAGRGQLAAGLARVSRITFPVPAPPDEVAGMPREVAGLAPRDGADVGPPTEAMMAPAAVGAPDEAPEDETRDEVPAPAADEPDVEDEDTAGHPVPGFGSVPAAAAALPEGPEPDTADSPVAGTEDVAAQGAADADFDEDGDHDGLTRAGSWEQAPFAARPGIPGQPQAPSVTARPVARLVMSHGETVDVDRAVLVGRAPEARRFPSAEQPRLVTVPSPQQEISSTHLEIRPGSGADHGSAVVTDLGSTNGTVVVQPGLAPEDLQPGIAVQLIPGAVIDLGDGLTIQVVNP